MIDYDKLEVKDFWNNASCGENLYLKGNNLKEAFIKQANIRYSLEPYILPFLNFPETSNKNILE